MKLLLVIQVPLNHLLPLKIKSVVNTFYPPSDIGFLMFTDGNNNLAFVCKMHTSEL